MTYKIGDRVILKKEKGEGVVIKLIKNNKILVRLEYGFEREFFMNNIISFKFSLVILLFTKKSS